jgi:carbon storage regulator
MLVLSRRTGESVMVGDDVVVTVLEVRGDVIRLGINAPRTVQVHREEVYRELQAANRDAASPSDTAVAVLSQLLLPPGPQARPGPSRRPEPTLAAEPTLPAGPTLPAERALRPEPAPRPGPPPGTPPAAGRPSS